jgi:PAS domain S-box-containing protein
MGIPLRTLIIEDNEDDAHLVIRALQKGGFDPAYERVDTAIAMSEALGRENWNVIVSDFNMPHFSGLGALKLYQEKGLDIPFIIVSGAIGEEAAVAAMVLGAHDYVMKNNLPRLVPAIQRELRETESRRERKMAEEALGESEKKYRLLADNANDVIFLLDMNLHYTYVSPSVKALRGYEPEQVLKEPSLESLTPSSRDLAMRSFSEIMEAGRSEHRDTPVSRTLELEMRRKDGDTVWTEVKLSLVRDEDQRPVGILGVTRDITERKGEFERIKKALGATAQAIAVTVETKDSYTAGHQRRVADLACAMAVEMNLPIDMIDGIRMAAALHDLGKISVPAEILSKPTKLSDIEFMLIRTHSQCGYDILKDIEFPWPVARIVLEHHERMNGSGYPNGLAGDDILMESRILSVADVMEAMATNRPYRASLGPDAALNEISKNKGILYDAEVP